MTPERDERRALVRAEQMKIEPGSGMRAAFDRGSWSAAGQRVAGEWTWAGTLSGIATFVVLAAVLVFALNARPSALAIGFVVFLAMIARGRALHLRYLRRAPLE